MAELSTGKIAISTECIYLQIDDMIVMVVYVCIADLLSKCRFLKINPLCSMIFSIYDGQTRLILSSCLRDVLHN